LSKNVAVFVDVANLYYSARGQEVDVDYVALLKTATKGRDLIRAYAYSGLDPENENQRKFIDFLGKNDYKVITKDIRKFGDGRVKANLDIELVVDLFRLADRMDIAVIVSGDGDFAPAIRALQDKGVRCEVISFRPNTSSDLIAVADEFIDIMKIIGIGRGKEPDKASKVMSAPPMPAKEVIPEFGFRDAPASVAAAAMAALREGKDGKPAAPRGRGRGRTRSETPSGEAEPVAVAPAVEADASAAPAASTQGEAATGESTDGRRRRRRRGGRGRGRGGRGRTEEATTVDAPGAGEIGWVELDDISQIDDLGVVDTSDAESREYTFEEADASTLAELGLTQTAGPAAEPSAESSSEAPKPRRSRSARPKAAAEPSAETAAESSSEAPKPRRSRSARPKAAGEPSAESTSEAPKARRSRSARPKAAGEPSAESTSEAPKARRSRSARPKAAAEPAPSPDATADGEEGIWQRFRSGRKTPS
jgi:uncharacterized LabA/DUF88 family protein